MAMAGVVKMAIDRYTTIVDRISDPRVHEWPLMSSPIPTLMMVVTYLYIVVILGPRIMANKKPFKLRRVLIGYNAFQVVFSAFMLYEHLMSGWFSDYSYKCQPVDYSHSQKAVRMLNLCWWYYISKLTEFADTIFFVMRKKDSQITFLHLYHHSLTPIETWVLVKFIAGGHGTFSNLINNMVHVIMYFYYMMSAMGPEYQKYLWWKKHLTHIQLLQFTLVFFHSLSGLFSDCGYPKIISAFLVFHSVVFFVLFGNFYLQTYKKQAKSVAAKEAQMNGTITNGTITNGTISNGIIKNGVVANGKIANGAVTNGKIANGIVSNGTPLNGTKTNGIIANGTITNIKISYGHIANGSVFNRSLSNGSLSNGNLSNDNLSNGSLSNGNLSNGSVPNGAIMNDATSNVLTNGLTHRKLANGTAQIGNGTSHHIPNGTPPNIANGTATYVRPNGIIISRPNSVPNGFLIDRINGTTSNATNGVPNGRESTEKDESSNDFKNKKD